MTLTQLAGQQSAALAAWARQVLDLPDPLAAPVATPVEVEWHADYYGGPWDDCGEFTVVEVPVAAPELLTDANVAAAFTAQVAPDPRHILRWLPAPTEEA